VDVLKIYLGKTMSSQVESTNNSNPSRNRVLIVDDDPHIRDILVYALEKENITVLQAENGQQGLMVAKTQHPDLIVLDVMMPDMNGLDLCRELRKTSPIPILFLSSRDSEIDKIIGLELGGDDYVTKPFSPRELVARVNAMCRRINFTRQSDELSRIDKLPEHSVLSQGKLTLDSNRYEVQWNSETVNLTATEFNLLQTLLQHPHKVYTRDELIQADIFKDIITDRTIDSHIRRLRQKLAAVNCPNAVETVHGFGYKLGTCQ
jgi:two-component system, OmpR family, response regulator